MSRPRWFGPPAGSTERRSATSFGGPAPRRTTAQRAKRRSGRRGMRGDSSLNHLIRPLENRLGDRQAEGFGGIEVDDQFEFGGLLNGQIGTRRALSVIT